jgi:hypothetical protein
MSCVFSYLSCALAINSLIGRGSPNDIPEAKNIRKFRIIAAFNE